MSSISIETCGKIIGSMHDMSFSCPNCGLVESADDAETAEAVVSFHGETDHSFSCGECGTDYIVRETVMRSFVTGLTSAEIE